MKKMLVLAAVALATTPAFASKARLSALQGAAHLSDTRDVLTKPDRAAVLGEFATLEVGPAANSATDVRNPEGGFVRKLGDNSAMGAYLGSKSGLAHSSLGLSGSYTYKIQNPLNLVYSSKMGDMSWGLGLQYAASENKVVKSKSSVMGLMASAASAAGWDAQLALGLTGEATVADTTKVEQSAPMSISGGYLMDSLYIYGGYEMLGAKTKVSGTGTAEKNSTTMKVGVVNTLKKDGADFFYGVEYNMNTTQEKIAPKNKTETTKLPIIVGIEAEAASWLVVRGSIKQSVLMASTKTTPDGAAATTDTSLQDDTVVAGGMGVKLGKFTIDGTLAGTGASQLGLDGNNFMADLGITYKF